MLFKGVPDNATETRSGLIKKSVINSSTSFVIVAENMIFCFFVGNVDSVKNMTPIGKFSDDKDELKNVKPGNVLRLYEETT